MRALIFMLLTFCFSWTNAQEYLIDLRIKKLQYQDDSSEFEVAKEFEILTDKTSEIISLGKVGEHEIGIQLEILKSELEGTVNQILAKVYYSRKSKSSDWQKIHGFEHSRISVNSIDSRVENEQKRVERINNAPSERLRQMYSRTNSESVGDPPDFRIDYLLFVYQNE